MPVYLDHKPVTQAAGTVSFGPVAIPDNLERFTLRLGRCTSQRPDLWAAPDTSVRIAVSLWIGGSKYEDYTPDTVTGGIVLGKNGQEAPEWTVSFWPIAMPCAACGNIYHPGIDYSRSLKHATIAFQAGKTITDVQNAETLFRGWYPKLAKAPIGQTLQDYRLRCLPVVQSPIDKTVTDYDAQLFARVFHTPTPAANPNRQVFATLTVTGPDLVTEVTAEST